MTSIPRKPRLLVIDDLFGRRVSDGRNRERADLCAQLLLRDVTDDESARAAPSVRDPVAEAVFIRGQTPAEARVGDIVENDLEGTLTSIRNGWAPGQAEDRWALVLLDLCFKTGRVTAASHASAPGVAEGRTGDDEPSRYFGLRLLEQITDGFPDLPVVILSGQERRDVSRLYAERRGLGFLERDEVTAERLRDYIWHHGVFPDQSGTVLGHSNAILLALRQARQAARSGGGWNNILLRGETGSGKELFARFIHSNSPAPPDSGRRPFVVVDAGVISTTLFQSELFGHRSGAFTGARESRAGLIATANGGDLFLDEIANAPPDVQGGLLRVVQDRIVIPLGGEGQGRQLSVRFLSATNSDIESSGSFRADLLYRLREAGTIVLPPLRERKDDIPVLAEHFVREAEAQVPNARRRHIAPETVALLQQQAWPGNVRELRSRLHEAVGRYRDVDYLLPIHLGIAEPAPAPDHAQTAPSRTPSKFDAEASRPPASVDELIRLLDGFRFDSTRGASINGKLPSLYGACARLIARYLSAALHATKKVRHDSPEGTAAIHPAMKLAMGDPGLTASRAADLVKRFLGLSPSDLPQEMRDPLLREALDRARHLRPSKGSTRKESAGSRES